MMDELGGGGGFVVTGHPGALGEWADDLTGFGRDLDAAREDAHPDDALNGEAPDLYWDRHHLLREVTDVVDQLQKMSTRADGFA